MSSSALASRFGYVAARACRKASERRFLTLSYKFKCGSRKQQGMSPPPIRCDCIGAITTNRHLSSRIGGLSDDIDAAGNDEGGAKRIRSRPLSLGYVAGLQSHSAVSHEADDDDETTWSSFDEAYDILEQIDPGVLYEFEQNLWDEDRMKFIHSTRDISVIDMEVSGEDKAIRSLVFNARPKLIQSSIEIDNVGATGPKALGAPPPLVGLTATHLGGLALAVPLWLAKNKNKELSLGDTTNKPRAIVIGAGGCTIPAVLAKVGCSVNAIEPHGDVCDAACRYFGAEDADVSLVQGYGEEYLSQDTATADLLIIDAEDGKLAPPQSMRKESFWQEIVLPRLSHHSIVAINVIADQKERIELRSTVDKVLQSHEVWCCEVPAIANVSDRHCIMFATPKTRDENFDTLERFKEELDKFDYVDMPEEWLNEIEQARTFRYYTSYFDSCNQSDEESDEEENRDKN